MDAKCGLGEQSDLGRVDRDVLAETGLRLDQSYRRWSLGHGPHRLVMALMADVDDVKAVAGHPLHLVVHLGDQRTDGVDDHRSPGRRPGHHFRCRAVRRKHHRRAFRHLVDVVDEYDTYAFKGLHHPFVVDDLVIAVHRAVEDAGHPGQGLDCHIHPGAKTSGLGNENPLNGHGPMVGGARIQQTLARMRQPAASRANPTILSTTSSIVMSDVSITTAPSGTIKGEA